MKHRDLVILTGKQRSFLRDLWIRVRDRLRGANRGYGGHPAVTRSLIEGLRQIPGADWAYPTRYGRTRAKTLHVVADPRAVRVGVAAKRKGLCDRLIVGPNIVVRAFEEDAVLASAEIDIVLVPSAWVKVHYENDEPSLIGRIAIWPAGVDADFWRPTGTAKRKVVIYEKGKPEAAAMASGLVRSLGFESVRIKYGSYTLDDYRTALDGAFACIVCGQSESQGIALFEAWAMNVPTFVRRYDRTPEGPCSAAPYLTDATGAFWETAGELMALLSGPRNHVPRDWVLENGTDLHSAKALLKIAGV